nr:transglycosylase SLT domain-containing protein [Campylobacter sp.]
MKNFVMLLCIFVSSSFAFAYNNQEIANSIKKQAILSNVDTRILYTIAKIESNFNPFVIAFTSKNKNFKFANANVKTQKYKDKYLIQIRSNDKNNLVKIAKFLINKGYKIDVGLMQINSVNFKENELYEMFSLDYNISKSIGVLSLCQSKMKNLKDTIECYNKGFKRYANKDYYARFKNSFNKDFGGVR